jgi:hypothetical protein
MMNVKVWNMPTSASFHLCSVLIFIKLVQVRVPLAHTYNPSFSEGRDQEDFGLKPAQANSSQHPILKKLITKKGLVEWLKG